MALLIKKEEHEFAPNSGKIKGFEILTEIHRQRSDTKPQSLDFNIRKLNPGEYSAPYHFHRYSEELFYLISGSCLLRTPEGITTLKSGDLVFFEAGDKDAHQLFNNTDSPCEYLDIRSDIGHDVVEYPDSGKIIFVPGGEIFFKDSEIKYFSGNEKEQTDSIWEQLMNH